MLTRNFSSKSTDGDEDYDEEYYESEEDEEENENEKESIVLSESEDKEKEATEIVYKVICPLLKSEPVFKPYDLVFALFRLDRINSSKAMRIPFSQRVLKFCDVNDKLVLNKVLMLGSQTHTIIGRPILPDAAVHAVVEEHLPHMLPSEEVLRS